MKNCLPFYGDDFWISSHGGPKLCRRWWEESNDSVFLLLRIVASDLGPLRTEVQEKRRRGCGARMASSLPVIV